MYVYIYIIYIWMMMTYNMPSITFIWMMMTYFANIIDDRISINDDQCTISNIGFSGLPWCTS